MLLQMSLLRGGINNPLRRVLDGVKGTGGEEKNFSVLRLRQKNFFRPLTPAGFRVTLGDWGNAFSVPPVPPWGRRGEEPGGFSLFPIALFLFCYPGSG